MNLREEERSFDRLLDGDYFQEKYDKVRRSYSLKGSLSWNKRSYKTIRRFGLQVFFGETKGVPKREKIRERPRGKSVSMCLVSSSSMEVVMEPDLLSNIDKKQ